MENNEKSLALLPEDIKGLQGTQLASKYLELLNRTPPKQQIKENKGVKYLPIEQVENRLDMLFPGWELEILNNGLVANSVWVKIRLHYYHPVIGEKKFMDGIGAMPLQTDQGSGPTEFEKIKHDAVMKALPAAESYALKDAAEKLGRTFGRNISRKGDPAFVNIWGDQKPLN